MEINTRKYPPEGDLSYDDYKGLLAENEKRNQLRYLVLGIATSAASALYTYAVCDWTYPPTSTSFPFPPYPKTKLEKRASHIPVTVSGQIELIASCFGFNKTQLSEIFGVSRPTIYSWAKGDAELLNVENSDKLAAIAELASKISGMGHPLFHGFVEQPIVGETSSIYDMLRKKKLDTSSLERLLQKARQLTFERDRQLGKLTPTRKLPLEQEEQILSNNLSFFGLEG